MAGLPRSMFAWKILRVLPTIYNACLCFASPSYDCALVICEVYYLSLGDPWPGGVCYVYSRMGPKAVNIERILLAAYVLLPCFPIVAIPLLVTARVSVMVVIASLILPDGGLFFKGPGGG